MWRLTAQFGDLVPGLHEGVAARTQLMDSMLTAASLRLLAPRSYGRRCPHVLADGAIAVRLVLGSFVSEESEGHRMYHSSGREICAFGEPSDLQWTLLSSLCRCPRSISAG